VANLFIMGLGLPGGFERRAHARLEAHLEAGFEVPGEKQVFQCAVIDVSAAGARLRSEVALHPGQHGILVVAPPDEGLPVVALVEVVRTELRVDDLEHDAGVRFHDLAPLARQRLADLLVGLNGASAS
jgi:c-di-GMP-binding flagellar brake protein YcgR